MMIVVNVRMTIEPSKRASYLRFIDDLVQKSLQDQGNLSYAHYQDVNNEDQYLILEHWENQSALDAHLQTPHLINFKNHITDYTIKEPELLILNAK